MCSPMVKIRSELNPQNLVKGLNSNLPQMIMLGYRKDYVFSRPKRLLEVWLNLVSVMRKLSKQQLCPLLAK